MELRAVDCWKRTSSTTSASELVSSARSVPPSTSSSVSRRDRRRRGRRLVELLGGQVGRHVEVGVDADGPAADGRDGVGGRDQRSRGVGLVAAADGRLLVGAGEPARDQPVRRRSPGCRRSPTTTTSSSAGPRQAERLRRRAARRSRAAAACRSRRRSSRRRRRASGPRPCFSGQRPSISRVSQASSRDQKVTTPRRALKRSDCGDDDGLLPGPRRQRGRGGGGVALGLLERTTPESGVKTRLRPVRPGGVSWRRVTT